MRSTDLLGQRQLLVVHVKRDDLEGAFGLCANDAAQSKRTTAPSDGRKKQSSASLCLEAVGRRLRDDHSVIELDVGPLNCVQGTGQRFDVCGMVRVHSLSNLVHQSLVRHQHIFGHAYHAHMSLAPSWRAGMTTRLLPPS